MTSVSVKQFPIPEILVLDIKKHGDARGFFSETFNQQMFSDAGIGPVFVQDNQVLSAAKGIIRGMHFQAPPFDQAKLVRVCRRDL